MDIIRKPWTKQPPFGTKIDWKNPLTRGMTLAQVFGYEDGGKPDDTALINPAGPLQMNAQAIATTSPDMHPRLGAFISADKEPGVIDGLIHGSVNLVDKNEGSFAVWYRRGFNNSFANWETAAP